MDHFWGADIALDLFFGGIGVGTFIFAVLLSHFYKDRYKQISRLGAVITPLCVGLGFLFLIMHLGKPFRLYIVFLKFRVTSPIWWGSWLQAIFFGLSMIYAAMLMREGSQGTIAPADFMKRKLVGYVGLVFAIAVGVYHGFNLMVFNSRPLWNTGPVVVMSICGFVMTGIALVILVMSIVPRYRGLLEELKISRGILGIVILAQLFTIALWLSSLFYGPGESYQAMLTLMIKFKWLFWGGTLAIGLVLPLAIGSIAILVEKKTGKTVRFVPAVTSAMVLVGNFILRYVIIVAAQ